MLACCWRQPHLIVRHHPVHGPLPLDADASSARSTASDAAAATAFAPSTTPSPAGPAHVIPVIMMMDTYVNSRGIGDACVMKLQRPRGLHSDLATETRPVRSAYAPLRCDGAPIGASRLIWWCVWIYALPPHLQAEVGIHSQEQQTVVAARRSCDASVDSVPGLQLGRRAHSTTFILTILIGLQMQILMRDLAPLTADYNAAL